MSDIDFESTGTAFFADPVLVPGRGVSLSCRYPTRWVLEILVDEQDVAGLGLAKAVELIRNDLLAARKSGEDADIRFPISSVTVELKVVAVNEGTGKAGFKVPFIDLELGAGASRRAESTSTVTLVLGAPVDRSGQPVKVARDSQEEKG